MRHFLRLLIATTMVMPIGIGVAQRVGAATDTGTDCQHTTGSSTLSPGYPKLVPAAQYQAADTNDAKEKNPTITSSGSVTNCGSEAGGPTSGTFTSTITTSDPSDCNELLSVGDTRDPSLESGGAYPHGTIDIHWNTGQNSHAKIKLLPDPAGNPTHVLIKTKGLTGLFAGLKGKQTIAFSATGGGCTTADLTNVTVSEVTPLEID
jgi:hypothetical protein